VNRSRVTTDIHDLAPDDGDSSVLTTLRRVNLLSRVQPSWVSWGYLVVNLPLVVAIFWLPRYHVYLWGALGLGSAAAVTAGIIRNQPTRRSAWVFVALGVSAFAMGDISYDVLTEFMHERNPFPSIADILYLATYLLLSTGVAAMATVARPSTR
jgi:hypothetical protein